MITNQTYQAKIPIVDRSSLQSQGGYDYKAAIVNRLIAIIEQNPGSQDTGTPPLNILFILLVLIIISSLKHHFVFILYCCS